MAGHGNRGFGMCVSRTFIRIGKAIFHIRSAYRSNTRIALFDKGISFGIGTSREGIRVGPLRRVIFRPRGSRIVLGGVNGVD